MKTSRIAAALCAAVLVPLVHAVPATGLTPGRPVAGAAVALDAVRVLAGVSAREGGVSFAGRVYFAGDTEETGTELWVSDGTPGGTRQVIDLVPGPEDSSPHSFAVYRGRLYFAAWSPVTGFELWSTDGTATGTTLAVDILPGSDGAYPGELVVAGETIYFAAQDPARGRELWMSDGTAAGTRLVIEIIPGASSSRPSSLTAFGDRIVYSAQTTSAATKPFVSGPGVPGARQLDPLDYRIDLRPAKFVVLGDLVIFRAGDDQTGFELWVSRGRPGDAHLVKDIEPGVGSSAPGDLRALGSRVVFAATSYGPGRELWSTDGTESGTVQVLDIDPLPGRSSDPHDLTLVDDRVVFVADDGHHGRELWTTTGTPDSTRIVTDAYAGLGHGVPGGLDGYAPVAGQLLYAGGGARGAEPWSTDGTRSRPLADLAPGLTSSRPQQVGTAGNAVLFVAHDGTADRLYAWTAVGSTTTVQAKRRYTAKQARAKRIVLKVRVRSAQGRPLSGGMVTVTRKGKALGRARLVDGRAKVRITVRLRPGRTHRVIAAWSGVATLATGSTGSVKVRVLRPSRQR